MSIRLTTLGLFAAAQMLAWSFIASTTAQAQVASQASPPPPHVVYIMSDDQGWNDVGYHGSEIKTPHIDALVQGGAKLEQFYAQPLCSPTRSSLMTGRYPFRMGLQVGIIRPQLSHGIPLEERLLPQALKERGYYTAIVGKWHLGLSQRDMLPTARGFDHQYGHYCGAIDYFKKDRDGSHDWHRNDKAVYEEGYSTDLLGSEAVKLIENHDLKQPLFLYVPFNAVHTPLQAPKKYIDMYTSIKNQDRRVFAAMATCMDDNIGRIVDAIEKRGMRDNTLIIFHSDNGGATGHGADNTPLRAGKGRLYEGGVRVVALANWPSRIKSGTVINEPMHVVDMYPTLINLAGGSLEQKLPIDGLDVWPVITQGKPSPHEAIVHQIDPGRAAIRVGEFKLVVHENASADEDADDAKPAGKANPRRAKASKVSGREIELFNITQDPNEKQNLAKTQPQRVAQMQALVERYQSEAAKPFPQGKSPGWTQPKVWGEP
jgi:arylsulfatase A-like enzyme